MHHTFSVVLLDGPVGRGAVAGAVPTDDTLVRVVFLVEGEHVVLELKVNADTSCGVTLHREAVTDLHGAVHNRSEKGTKDLRRVVLLPRLPFAAVSPCVMVHHAHRHQRRDGDLWVCHIHHCYIKTEPVKVIKKNRVCKEKKGGVFCVVLLMPFVR